GEDSDEVQLMTSGGPGAVMLMNPSQPRQQDPALLALGRGEDHQRRVPCTVTSGDLYHRAGLRPCRNVRPGRSALEEQVADLAHQRDQEHRLDQQPSGEQHDHDSPDSAHSPSPSVDEAGRPAAWRSRRYWKSISAIAPASTVTSTCPSDSPGRFSCRARYQPT